MQNIKSRDKLRISCFEIIKGRTFDLEEGLRSVKVNDEEEKLSLINSKL